MSRDFASQTGTNLRDCPGEIAARTARTTTSVASPTVAVRAHGDYGAAMVTMRLATAADVGRVTTTFHRAFADDPVLRWFFVDDDDYATVAPVAMGNMARRFIATDTLWCTDDVVAIACWVPPGRPEVEVESDAIDHPAWRLARFASMGAMRAEHTPAEPHWYLNVLATHPDWQRQGHAGALMAHVFELADDMGLPCYLETETEVNVAYYRHHGFEVRSEWDLRAGDDVGPHMWGMLRPVR
jgi:GNAT superfamily N-acetyltransferase